MSGYISSQYDSARDYIKKQDEQIKILKEALEFYGDRKNWMMLPTSSHPECSSFYDVINDEHGDKRAREALKKIEGMK